jgi:hypothetical protein
MRYVVVENTPGYMPENDDPFTTDDLSEARREMLMMVRRCVEHNEAVGLKAKVTFTTDSAYIETDAPYDLGRVIEIMENEDD